MYKKVSRKLILSVSFLYLITFHFHAININLSFSAGGVSDILDSVVIENLTQKARVSVAGNQTVNLSDITSIIPAGNLPDQRILITPNPLIEKSKVVFFADQCLTAQVSILTLDGRKMFSTSTVMHEGSNHFDLTIEKGIYILQINMNSETFTTKIISLNVHQTGFSMNNSASEFHSGLQRTTESVIHFPYRIGDLLLFKGYSGNYCTVLADNPLENKQLNFRFVSCKDADENFYPVTIIGNQIWMAENLRTTKFRNNNSISDRTDVETWDTIQTDAFSNYENNFNHQKYGLIYNGRAVANAFAIAPKGWHIPSDEEWSILTDYLGGVNIAGEKLKERYLPDWSDNSSSTAVSTGFGALPGGIRNGSGKIRDIGKSAYWWSSSTDQEDNSVWGRQIINTSDEISRIKISKNSGVSVRCVIGDYPEVSTSGISSINSFSAKCGGKINFDGNLEIITRGICWSRSPNPTIADQQIQTVEGETEFQSAINGLDPATTYYVRAFATNSYGTGYGEEQSFTTTESNLNIAGYSLDIILFKHTDGRLFCTKSGDLSTFDRNGENKVTLYSFAKNGYSGYNIHMAKQLPNGTIIVALTAYKNTMKFLRSTNASYTSWELVHEDWNGQMLYRGWVVTPDGTIYAGEYPTHNNIDKVRLWKATDNGKTWSVVHTWNGRQGTITTEKTIFHIHVVAYDKYTGLLWIGCGDNGVEPAVYTWNGTTMTMIGEGTQLWRQCSFVFTPEHVIWGTDGEVTYDKTWKCRMVRYNKSTKTTEIVASAESTLFNCEEISGFAKPLYLSCGTPNEVFLSNDTKNWRNVLNITANPAQTTTNSWFYNFVDGGDGRLYAYITGIIRHDTGLPFTNGGTIILDVK